MVNRKGKGGNNKGKSSGPEFLQKGNIILAKYGQYPQWPAMISNVYSNHVTVFWLPIKPTVKSTPFKVAKKNCSSFQKPSDNDLENAAELLEAFKNAEQMADNPPLMGINNVANDSSKGDGAPTKTEDVDGASAQSSSSASVGGDGSLFERIPRNRPPKKQFVFYEERKEANEEEKALSKSNGMMTASSSSTSPYGSDGNNAPRDLYSAVKKGRGASKRVSEKMADLKGVLAPIAAKRKLMREQQGATESITTPSSSIRGVSSSPFFPSGDVKPPSDAPKTGNDNNLVETSCRPTEPPNPQNYSKDQQSNPTQPIKLTLCDLTGESVNAVGSSSSEPVQGGEKKNGEISDGDKSKSSNDNKTMPPNNDLPQKKRASASPETSLLKLDNLAATASSNSPSSSSSSWTKSNNDTSLPEIKLTTRAATAPKSSLRLLDPKLEWKRGDIGWIKYQRYDHWPSIPKNCQDLELAKAVEQAEKILNQKILDPLAVQQNTTAKTTPAKSSTKSAPAGKPASSSSTSQHASLLASSSSTSSTQKKHQNLHVVAAKQVTMPAKEDLRQVKAKNSAPSKVLPSSPMKRQSPKKEPQNLSQQKEIEIEVNDIQSVHVAQSGQEPPSQQQQQGNKKKCPRMDVNEDGEEDEEVGGEEDDEGDLDVEAELSTFEVIHDTDEEDDPSSVNNTDGPHQILSANRKPKPNKNLMEIIQSDQTREFLYGIFQKKHENGRQKLWDSLPSGQSMPTPPSFGPITEEDQAVKFGIRSLISCSEEESERLLLNQGEALGGENTNGENLNADEGTRPVGISPFDQLLEVASAEAEREKATE